MKSLDIISEHLKKAKKSHANGDIAFRESELLEAFAQLEVERLKFYMHGKFDLGELGYNLNSFVDWLNTCMFQFTADSCVDEEEWNKTLRVRLDTLEYYIIKILAISKILTADENRDTPIKVCGYSDGAQLMEAK